MQDRIETMLAGGYRMFYLPEIDPLRLTPLLRLPVAMAQANEILSSCSDLDLLTELELDCLARMVRVKWIYQHIATDPVRKPILMHVEDNTMMVDCGDTRLMALDLMAVAPSISVLTTCLTQNSDEFATWQEITNESTLSQNLELDLESTHIQYTATDVGTAWAVSWLEIGDDSTSHHLHDTQKCLDLLGTHDLGKFQFTRAWFDS